jgi:L-fucose isomerase-like protein
MKSALNASHAMPTTDRGTRTCRAAHAHTPAVAATERRVGQTHSARQQPTRGCQDAAATVRRIRRLETDNIQQTTCTTTDRSVEIQPMAVTCVREAVRHTEGSTSCCLLLTAASCATPTTRQLAQVHERETCVASRTGNR